MDAPGDETTTVLEFFPSASSYIVDKVAHRVSFDGVGFSGAKLEESSSTSASDFSVETRRQTRTTWSP